MSWQQPWLDRLTQDNDHIHWPMFRLLVQKALHFATTAAEDALEICGALPPVSPFRGLMPVDVAAIRDVEFVPIFACPRDVLKLVLLDQHLMFSSDGWSKICSKTSPSRNDSAWARDTLMVLLPASASSSIPLCLSSSD
jgi:hypothetical protein